MKADCGRKTTAYWQNIIRVCANAILLTSKPNLCLFWTVIHRGADDYLYEQRRFVSSITAMILLCETHT